jgi:oligopeptidase B
MADRSTLERNVALFAFTGLSAAAYGAYVLWHRRRQSVMLAPVASTSRGKFVLFGKTGDEFRGDNPMDPPRALFDPYFWLRDDDRKDSEVISHLRRENAHARKKMQHLKGTVDYLYKEMLSHVKETDDAVPYPFGDYYYYSRTVEGLSYKLYCRKRQGLASGSSVVSGKDDLCSPEEVLLDMNEQAKGLAHCDLEALEPSPDHTVLAYSLDTLGYETFSIFFKHLGTGNMLSDELVDTCGEVEWGKDACFVYYTTVSHGRESKRRGALQYLMCCCACVCGSTTKHTAHTSSGGTDSALLSQPTNCYSPKQTSCSTCRSSEAEAAS